MSTITTYPFLLPVDPGVKAQEWLARRAGQDEWGYQEKIDGVRAMAVRGRLITKGGVDVTDRFPEIVPNPDLVMDGEIAVVNAEGHADFEQTARKAGGGHGGDAAFHAFDILDDGRDLREEIYIVRMNHLIWADRGAGVEVLMTYAHDSVDIIWLFAVEGLVARRLDAPYVGGRTPTAVKLKKRTTHEAIVVGRKPGKGSRSGTFGALQLAVVDVEAPGGVRRVGDVGSGFSDRDIVDVLEQLATGTPFVVEVEALGLTSKGKLRQPVFVRLRPDADLMDVRW